MATYLVTGTNRGIGLEFVRQLLARGETVLATCRDIDKADELRALQQESEQLELFELDVAEATSLYNLPKRLEGRAIDVFINNAGVYVARVLARSKEKSGWTYSESILLPRFCSRSC